MHNDSLNKWTLRFNEADVEAQYRAHFAESADRQWSGRETVPTTKTVSIIKAEVHEKYLKFEFKKNSSSSSRKKNCKRIFLERCD